MEGSHTRSPWKEAGAVWSVAGPDLEGCHTLLAARPMAWSTFTNRFVVASQRAMPIPDQPWFPFRSPAGSVASSPW